jgi:MFS family permease
VDAPLVVTRLFVVLLANFALLGIVFGAQSLLWAELMPALGVGPGLFGSAQLVSPLVSVTLLLLGGQLAAWAGKKRLGVASLLLMGGASLALAGSADLWAFAGALALLGAANGLFETAMNGAALDSQRASGRETLNVLHAGFSAGAVAGALGTGLLLGFGWGPGHVLGLLTLLCGLTLAATLPVPFPAEEPHAGSPGGGDSGAALPLLLGRGPLRVLAAICMLGAVGESVAFLWSVIYLHQRGAGVFVGGVTVALFSGAMLVGRLLNARLLRRRGPGASLLASGCGLILACLLLLLPGGLPLAVGAFVLLGLAVAGVVPTALSAGARLAPGRSGALAGGLLAAVYVSFMVCPPVVGWLADWFSLQAALLTVGLSGLGIAWLARRVDALRFAPRGLPG